MSSFHCVTALAALAALLASASPALAQSAGLALDRFAPAPAGDRMFGVDSPYVAGELAPHLMLLGDYAHNPLVLRTTPNNAAMGAVVGNQLFLHLNGSISLWNRLAFNVDAPVALYQEGGSPTVATEMFSSPSKVQFGDLRLGARVRIWGEYHDPFQIAAAGYVWLPTGARDAFVGTGKVRGLPEVILGGHVANRAVWSAAIGYEIAPSGMYAGIPQGSMLRWGAGFGLLFLDDRRLQIGPEASGTVPVRDLQQHTVNAELLVDVRYRLRPDLEIGASAGPGLTAGIGTPAFRSVLMLAYTQEPQRDRDHDGILDAADACPDAPGVRSEDPRKDGCPTPPDRDHDGVADAEDACPDLRGVATGDARTNGCPPPPKDRDGDGVPDTEDACPDVRGVLDADPQKNGCPPPPPLPADTDGDGIPDAADACPGEKGPTDPDPKKNGCPTSVRVTETEIVILEQVQFDTGKSTIRKVSGQLLDEVAGVLREHPEITQIEVQGHTDDRGPRRFNQALSQARAEAVMKALIQRGIQGGRLLAMGYGQDVPIADNTTDAGQRKNRRVQFTIVAKQTKRTP